MTANSMAEIPLTGNLQPLPDGPMAPSGNNAEVSAAILENQQSGASTAEQTDAASASRPLLDPDLLEACKHLEEELEKRTLALATLAHEMKNPLAIISGYVDMLISRKVGPLTERQGRILEETRANCARLQKFTVEFLAYSSLTMGNPSAVLRLEAGDLNACLSEVCGYWMDRFSAKAVALYFRPNME